LGCSAAIRTRGHVLRKFTLSSYGSCFRTVGALLAAPQLDRNTNYVGTCTGYDSSA
jgi:hypothetical protein